MPSSESMNELKYSPMLKKIGIGFRQTFDVIETVVSLIVTSMLMVFTFMMFCIGSVLFQLWDSAMILGGRKQEIYENTTLSMIRYVIWFKDTQKTNRYNIYINHYITSTEDYVSEQCKSCGLILYGMLREDYQVKDKDIVSEGPTKVRRMWNSTLHYPKDSIKYIVKPNTTCWELVFTKKVEDNKKD